ncbi:MAG: type II secretion system protein GspJ [Ponticaulis sp.]|nr:type II secretion system protein GspJ [Ponticaulis sp.]|tara:strand:- start:5724 stop:6338 length:615 start_codon:yes stop_codon:yes gene_type:complete
MRRDAGFSLVEVMVALFILSVISAAGTTILLRSVTGKEVLETATERINTYTRVHSRIRDDLLQWVPRRAESRATLDPKAEFLGGGIGDSTLLFAFVRDGWTNPGLAETRSGLISVRYSLSGNQLVRTVQTVADPLYNSEGVEEILFDDVAEAYAEFRQGPQWLNQWRGGDGGREGAPIAVRLHVELLNGEEFDWLFLTPSGGLT